MIPTPRKPKRDEIIRVGDQFYVLATSSRADDRTRVLKHSDTFGVFDRYGDVQPVGLGEQGLYHEGTRFLSRFELLLDGSRPLLLSSSVDKDNIVLTIDLSNPDLSESGDIVVPRGSVHLQRSRIIWNAVCYERILLRNFHERPVAFLLTLRFEADFADMFEVRGVERQRRGHLLPTASDDRQTVLSYEGLDGVRRTTRIRYEPRPHHRDDGTLDYDIRLEAHGQIQLEMQTACESSIAPPPIVDCFEPALARATERMFTLRQRGCEVHTSSEPFNDWLNRSRADLHLMVTQTDHGPYPYAGVPWFSSVFGRDGIITALQTLWFDPQIARGVLGYLASTQADKVDAQMDAEPGKIVHEVRGGEMAAMGEVPYAKYYGSVDSTPLFIILAGEYLRRTGDREFCRTLWPHVQRALAWIDEFGDADHDGFVEYRSRSRGGLNNQGWKDSRDCVFHEDATLAEGAIALCEVQGYVYAARRRAAEMAQLLGEQHAVEALTCSAEALREGFWKHFWDERLGLYVLALDGAKRPCRVASSNAGQCLFTEIAHPDHAHRLGDLLLDRHFFSGWGIRTLASDQPRYNPMSYHNGSIWPHDNALIALGLLRYGLHEAAARVMTAMFDLSSFVESHRLPELICGFERRRAEGPILYPLACSPQAWAAGSVFLLLQACMGLCIRADRNEVSFEQSVLPEFLQSVQLRNLQIGGQSLDLALERRPHDVTINLLRRASGVRVISVR